MSVLPVCLTWRQTLSQTCQRPIGLGEKWLPCGDCVCKCVCVRDGLGVGNDCPPVSAQFCLTLTIMQWQNVKRFFAQDHLYQKRTSEKCAFYTRVMLKQNSYKPSEEKNEPFFIIIMKLLWIYYNICESISKITWIYCTYVKSVFWLTCCCDTDWLGVWLTRLAEDEIASHHPHICPA